MNSLFFITKNPQESEDDELRTVETKTRHLTNAFDSDEEEEPERVVKSKSQRLTDGLGDVIHTMRNKLKIGDWSAVETQYKALNQMIAKNQKDLIGK